MFAITLGSYSQTPSRCSSAQALWRTSFSPMLPTPLWSFSHLDTCSWDSSIFSANCFCVMSSARRINRTSFPSSRAGLSARVIAAARASPCISGIPVISSLHDEQRCTTTAFKTLTTNPPKSSTCSGFTVRSINPLWHFVHRMTRPSLFIRPSRDHFYFTDFFVHHDNGSYFPSVAITTFRPPLLLAIFSVGFDKRNRATTKHVCDVELFDLIFLAFDLGMVGIENSPAPRDPA